MSDEIGQTTAGEASPPVLSAVDRLLDGWLDELDRSGSALLDKRGRDELRRALDECFALGRPGPAVAALASSCPREELQSAARVLWEMKLAAADSGGLAPSHERVIAELMAALDRSFCEGAEGAGGGAGESGVDGAGELWEATNAMQSAATSEEVIQSLMERALRLSGATGAVWWEQEDDACLRARSALGVELGEERERLPLSEGFWSEGREAGRSTVRLSSSRPDHAPPLRLAGGGEGLMVRAHDGRQWIGALSVHGETVTPEAASMLVALSQQAASVLRARYVEARADALTEAHRQCTLELGKALSSAVNLDSLLNTICRLAASICRADACTLFLEGAEGRLSLRAEAFAFGDMEALDGEALRQEAERVRQAEGGMLMMQAEGGEARAAVLLREAGFESGLGVSLPVRGEPFGVLILLSRRRDAFPGPSVNLILSFAAQSAVAIENLQLLEDMQQRLLEMADLTWVSGHVVAIQDVEKIASTVCDGAARALDVPRMALFLAEATGELRVAATNGQWLPAETEAVLLEGGHVGTQALASGAPTAIDASDPARVGEDPLLGMMGSRSLLCAPLTTPQGPLGLLVAGDLHPRAFGTRRTALLSAYANQAALALQSAVLYQDVLNHLNDLSKLFELVQKLASSPSLHATLEAVLSYSAELLAAPMAAIMLEDRDQGQFVVRATHGLPADTRLHQVLKFRRGEGLAGKAVQSGTVLASSDVGRDGRVKFRELLRDLGVRAGVSAPLVSQGRTIGVVSVYRTSCEDFKQSDKQLLMAVASAAAVAVENARLHQDAEERSQFMSALMHEINHRMRNSLQTVVGLLRMELKRPHKRSLEGAVERGIAHVQTMAVVNDLMGGREFQLVDMKRAARQVLNLTCQAAGAGAGVKMQISGARVMLPSHQATGVALVLGELTDNAFRHGLRNSDDGRITVSLAESGGEVVVQVKDNGVGLPEGFRADNASGLGLGIVKGVVEQDLGGKVEFEEGGGLTVRIRFPKQQGAP